ncbi:hypothetical protein Tco_0942906, partial [Tanacetum coccineum]
VLRSGIHKRRWLLTYGMKLAMFNCLNSPKYLSAFGVAISKAIEKGMQDGLAARITHGQEGRVLTDVVAFNPSAEDDFTSALQEVQNMNFSLLVELQSNKDASVKAVMDLLHLDEALAERLALEGMGGTSSVAPDTTTALSMTLASASTISPISMDDYKIAHAKDQGNAGADVDPFSNVDDAELIIS